jgi:glycosyltransferase involved in cell wall biosynthesis
LVVGEGPAGRAFQARVGEAMFAGHLEGEALGRAVASADILINPSVTEAFGNVNLEAMAAGLAVVSADVASAQALIEPDTTGILIPPHDVPAYTDAVHRLILDPQLRGRLGKQASLAASAYDWPTILDDVVQAYRTLVPLPPR